MTPAVRIENLSKLYRIGARQQAHYRTLRESLMDAAAAPWRRWQTLRNQSRVAAHELIGHAGDCPNSVKSAEQGTDRRLVGTVPITLSTNGQAATNGHAPTSGQPAASSLPPAPLTAPPDTIWALNDVSFDVQHGEVVGIIGRNGAGKSTLLKILSRITEPTRGRVVLNGRVASLLEVGTGFHPELTGRENIYLNGAILGMHRHEIRRKFDAIADFSGVETFLDTPVKRYSSGMYVRLAFAVAAHLDPEILIIDEVLAVGDAEFQKKCLGKMNDVAKSGRTVLFVSHNMAAVGTLCARCVLFESGKLIVCGQTNFVLSEYRKRLTARSNGTRTLSDSCTTCKIRSVVLCDQDGMPTNHVILGNDFHLRIEIDASKEIENSTFGVGIDDIRGDRIATVHNPVVVSKFKCDASRRYVHCRIPVFPLAPGEYTIKVAISSHHHVIDSDDQACHFHVVDSDAFGEGRGFHRGKVALKSDWWDEDIEQTSIAK